MSNLILAQLKKELRTFAVKKYAIHYQKFFKTGKGEYGEGDKFIGVRVPIIRKLAKKYIEINYPSVNTLINSKIHEERLLGLIILTLKYSSAEKVSDELELKKIYQLYCASFKKINNWDLIDVTCPHIVGKYLHDRDRKILIKWAKSDHLWTRRIAMVSNWWFIRKGDLNSVFILAKILLQDEHDLIHKAVGWMLREAGKKDMIKTEIFMKRHYKNMPRTMLRYAIERYPEPKRLCYLKGTL